MFLIIARGLGSRGWAAPKATSDQRLWIRITESLWGFARRQVLGYLRGIGLRRQSRWIVTNGRGVSFRNEAHGGHVFLNIFGHICFRSKVLGPRSNLGQGVERLLHCKRYSSVGCVCGCTNITFTCSYKKIYNIILFSQGSAQTSLVACRAMRDAIQ